MGTEGRTLATARMRLGGHGDPTTRPLVKATMKRLVREYEKPRKQAKTIIGGWRSVFPAGSAPPS